MTAFETAIMNRSMIEVNKSNLEQVIREAEEIVLVQFWGAWSASCKVMTTMLGGLMGDPSVPFRVVRVEMDRSSGLPRPYGVQTVPTLLIFNQGELQHQVIGLTTEQALREKLERAWHGARPNSTDGRPE